MNFSARHQQVALTLISGIGSRRARIVISHFESLDAFFGEKRLNLAKIPGIPSDFVSHKHRMQALEAADKVLESLYKLDGQLLFYSDADYPRRLKQCEDAPLVLYYKGNIDWNPEKIVAVVGTRHATDYGRQLTKELVEGVKSAGATVISGMAHGIDVCAHQMALRNELPTLGVLGHGLDWMYPSEHAKIAGEMLGNGGLITEFYPGLKPEPSYFPMRNRIVAGLADATIVVESGIKGGSLITANLAADYNRDVFAFPGDVNRPLSAGCHRLIQDDKAHLITRARDFLKLMNWEASKARAVQQRHLFVELNQMEQRIVEALKTKPDLTPDTLAYLTTMTVSQALTSLLELELKGVVSCRPGKRYSLV